MTAETTKVIGQLGDFIEGFIKKLSIVTTDTLSERTPKETTWAASNWIPGIGSFSDAPIGTKTTVGIAVDAQKDGKALVVKSYKLPQLVYITNNVDYITKLNDGTSAQAPSGFVQNSIAKAIKAVI